MKTKILFFVICGFLLTKSQYGSAEPAETSNTGSNITLVGIGKWGMRPL